MLLRLTASIILLLIIKRLNILIFRITTLSLTVPIIMPLSITRLSKHTAIQHDSITTFSLTAPIIMPLNITRLSILPLRITTLSLTASIIMPLSITRLSILSLNIMPLSIKRLTTLTLSLSITPINGYIFLIQNCKTTVPINQCTIYHFLKNKQRQ
jgi:hypothetical protein